MLENDATIIANYTMRQVIGLKFRLARALLRSIYTKHRELDNFSQKDAALFLSDSNKAITYHDIRNLEKGNGMLQNYVSLVMLYRSFGIHLSFFFDDVEYVNNIIQIPFTPQEGANYKALSEIISVKYEPTIKETESQKPIPESSKFFVMARIIDTITKSEKDVIIEDVGDEKEDIAFNKALELIENASRLSQSF
jgi:hypothetical protein